MGNFSKNRNPKTEVAKNGNTVNLAGGRAYLKSDELALASLLATSFGGDSAYQTAGEKYNQLVDLVSRVDPLFAAQAGIYARTVLGMRTISHVLAGELASKLSGKPYASSFYNKIVNRMDDMIEIIGYINSKNQKMSNAMKRGFALAFNRFDNYQVAKYKGSSGVKLVDVVNMVHPKPTEKNKEALAMLKAGTLRNTDTWEAQMSAAGQSDDVDAKSAVWSDLILSKKLGYMALVKNLRNIVDQVQGEVLDVALEQLIDEKAIRKSLLMPFRYLSAYYELKKANAPQKVLKAVRKAMDIALANVPKLDGETVVVLDVSRSMKLKEGLMGAKTPSITGGLFAAALCKTNDCELVTFDNYARYISLNTDDSVVSVYESIPFTSGGTNFKSIFETLNKAYKRIIILSDEQGWVGYNTPTTAYEKYKQKYKCNPFIYSFDLAGYGTMQLKEGGKVMALAGFSDKIFEVMGQMETDPQALINTIKAIKV